MQIKKETQKLYWISIALVSLMFLINILLKLDMFGERTILVGESWLSTVSAIYVENWLLEGINNLKHAMVRTYDSIEMLSMNDREVYASFLPGCLYLPFITAKIFSLKPNLSFIEFFASLYHFLGALMTASISFVFCRKLEFSSKKTLFYSCFSGFAYIFTSLNFFILSTGYYADTAVYIFFLLFLLTEFLEKSQNRLAAKAVLIFVGLFHEWFFVGITIASILSEINREDGKKNLKAILFWHLGACFLALSFYGYYIYILEKIEHSIFRLLRRSIFNPVSHSVFEEGFVQLSKQLYSKYKLVFIFSAVISFWNYFESKYFKNCKSFRNIFIVAFGSAMIQLSIALQHSAVHKFSGLKLIVPLCIFIPFFIEEISNFFPLKYKSLLRNSLFVVLILPNIFQDLKIISNFKPENTIYNQLEKIMKNYTYEDLFFSYNLEILQDKYPKYDIRTSAKNILPSDRLESEPFLHYSSHKQIYYIESPKDILKMLEYRNLKGKAKVHLLFHIETCENIEKQNLLKAIEEDFYIVDISDDELEKKTFENKFSCNKQLKPKVFFGLPNVK